MLVYLTQTTIFITVTAVIILFFKRVFKKRLSAKWNVWIWALLLIRFLVPSLPQSRVSVFNTVPTEAVKNAIQEKAVQPREGEVLITDDAGEILYMESHPQPTEESIPEQKTDIGSILLTVWQWGAVSLGLYFILVYCVHIRKIGKYKVIEDENAKIILDECREKLKIKRTVSVISGGEAPMLIGMFRPKIVLPEGYTEEEKRDIIIHELCHLKHNDILLIWLAVVIVCLNWFNPVIWYSFYAFRRDIEVYCDERVLGYTDNPKDYAKLLLKTALKRNQFVLGTTALQNGEKEVERRIKYIAGFKKPKVIWSVVMIAAALCIGAVCLTNGVVKGDKTKSPVPQEQPAQTDGIEKELTRDEQIRSVLPEGSSIFANSGLSWRFMVDEAQKENAVVLAHKILGGDNAYRNFVEISGFDIDRYIGKIVTIMVYAVDYGDGNSVPYMFVFDAESGEMLSHGNLKTHENEEIAIKAISVFERYFYSNGQSELYQKTRVWLAEEFSRVYTPYYDILSLKITDWQENGNEAYFTYTMTHKNYDRDPDTVDYIKKAKESGDKNYKIYYDEYLQPKEGNYQFKVVLDDSGNLNLYYDVAPKGHDYQPVKVDDFISGNWKE